MVFEHAEKLKTEYTDKYVIVDQGRPELCRFNGLTGTVRTVNMNGRALVEFDGFENIGWYDIDIDYLKVIDEPLPKTEEKEPAAAPKTNLINWNNVATELDWGMRDALSLYPK